MANIEHKNITEDDLHILARNSEEDPGSIGYGMAWFNPEQGLLQVRNAADAGWHAVSGMPVFRLEQFGLVNGEDATDALSDALDACGEAGGGTIVIPQGETLIEEGGIVKDFIGLQASINIVGAGSNSALKIRDASTNKIEIVNAQSVIVKDLKILGANYADVPTHFYRKLFSVGYVYRAHFENIVFAGIRMGNADSASSGAIYAYNSNLSLDRIIAGGSSSATKGFVTCERLLTLSVRNSQFLDYIEDGIDPEDAWVLVNSPYGWIFTHDPVQEGSGSRSRILLENCDFDEGATHPLVVAGNGEGGVTGSIVIRNCSDNAANFGGGYRLEDVEYAKIENSRVGLAATGDIPAIIAHNVDYLEVIDLNNSAHVNHIHLTGTAGKVSIKASSLNAGATYPTGVRNDANSAVTFDDATISPNSKSANYTTILLDAGRSIFHPASDNNARTYTIDSNANVKYQIGTVLTFINKINVLSIAIASDTLVWAEDGSTGTRLLAANGIATAVKTGTTEWLISGTGLS